MNELHRQVHPSWLKDGIPSSLTFRPFPKDDNKLSVYDGELKSASESYEHYTANYVSHGVVTVTCAECEAIELPAVSSPIEENPAHAHIEYAGLPASAVKAKSKLLTEAAVERDWTYRPEP